MNKKIILFFILISIFLLSISGCTQNSNSQNSDKIRIGTKGLSLSFLNGLPPDEIIVDPESSDNIFDVYLQIRNEGAYPSDEEYFEGMVFASGFDKAVIDGSWKDNGYISRDLFGKNMYLPQGSLSDMTYSDSNIEYPFNTENYEPTFQVTACYKYRTIASPMICLDPNYGKTNQADNVCAAKDTTLTGGQGAPVAVTKVEHTPSSSKDIFKIEVQNVGGGKIIKSGKYSDCLNLKYDDFDVVNYDVNLEGHSYSKECTPKDSIRLQDNKGYIICTFKHEDSGDAYLTPLEITLDYDYSQSISKKINLIKLN
jgi:hypothetical protein